MTSDVDLDTSWTARANCAGCHPDLFFPERGASTQDAKEVCRGCPVRQPCLEYALANSEKFGIWGGMSERERRRIRRERNQAARKAAAARANELPAGPDPTAEWWATSDVAAWLGVSASRVGVLGARGELPAPDRRQARPVRNLWRPASITTSHPTPAARRPLEQESVA